ncbi:hypothetical protein GZ78_04885 [Endozoicomonas numazuensis]|uniref:Uncharacterized protein n=2 Tax=Endozoicomonas numazuensis TaxID=1137799 RepID=A0A081NLJ1_9GAMM|nr:hypothetical protein GZ78_04885 [Endozoicomonas numazuensis]
MSLPPQERRSRSDSGYGSSPEDKNLQIRDITPEEVKLQPKREVENHYLTDKRHFDQWLEAMSETLIHCYAKRSRSQLPFWIQSNRYPLRQFRAYHLLALDNQYPARHKKLLSEMNDLEQKFMEYRDDLLNRTLSQRYVIASDLFNTLAAIQTFLGKTSEAERTIHQGFDFEPHSIIFSLQDALYDLKISPERVLEGFPQR